MKTQLLRLFNLLLYLASCLLIGTGLMLAWRLPPGSRGGRGLTVLGLDRHEWGDIHFSIALVGIGLGLVHLVLHWAWLKKVAAGRHFWKLAAGLGLGLLFILVFLFLPVEKREPQHRRPWQDFKRQSEIQHLPSPLKTPRLTAWSLPELEDVREPDEAALECRSPSVSRCLTPSHGTPYLRLSLSAFVSP